MDSNIRRPEVSSDSPSLFNNSDSKKQSKVRIIRGGELVVNMTDSENVKLQMKKSDAFVEQIACRVRESLYYLFVSESLVVRMN
jgi:hypothetical protein